jgi:hypothetical protein
VDGLTPQRIYNANSSSQNCFVEQRLNASPGAAGSYWRKSAPYGAHAKCYYERFGSLQAVEYKWFVFGSVAIKGPLVDPRSSLVIQHFVDGRMANRNPEPALCSVVVDCWRERSSFEIFCAAVAANHFPASDCDLALRSSLAPLERRLTVVGFSPSRSLSPLCPLQNGAKSGQQFGAIWERFREISWGR